MEFLGIGPLELVFILLIALIVLGPKDMVKAGRTMGRFLRSIVTSPTWKAVTQTSNELRRLPNRLIREAGLEEEVRKLEETKRQASIDLAIPDQEQWEHDISPWTTPPEEPTAGSEVDNPSSGIIMDNNGTDDESAQNDHSEDFTSDTLPEDHT